VRHTQWVCFGEWCLCSGEKYSCNCVPVHGDAAGRCICCRQPLHEIDTDTGAVIVHRCDMPEYA
jgi:hypothetical protein